MPAFSLSQADGTQFTYDLSCEQVLGIVILKAGQGQFSRLMGDLETLLQDLRAKGKPFDCVGVISGPGGRGYLQSQSPDGDTTFPLLLDPEFELWGRLGVIAAPTALVVGADRKVRWAKAGLGYDFVPGFHAQLAQALGLQPAGQEEGIAVQTLENASNRARMERHVRMARTLAEKERFELAISELEKARELDPNAVGVAFELAELLCRTGENERALKFVKAVQTDTPPDKARALLISGWAKRQMGALDEAEKLLSEGMRLDPKSARILYELGKVYQAKADLEQAVAYYRRALARLFNEAEQSPPPRQ
jgi:tetratricopeptide (TPR) repeat protein